jgi:DNA-binding NtrC family response regulator
MSHLLIVSDKCSAAVALREQLAGDCISCTIAAGVKQSVIQLATLQPDWVIANESLPDGCGLDLLRELHPERSALVLLSEQPTLSGALSAFRQGVTDYLEQPPDIQRLRQLIAARAPQPRYDSAFTESAIALLGESAVMHTLRLHIDRVAPTEASVLLLGESGTGKELVAQNIHVQSLRHRHAFLPVNCGAISPQLIESELFGHEKGSFTGADRQHKGYFERASGGTLFLDEVVEMPIELQVKLLRVLETGSFMRIGSNQELHTDVRIIAATNREPQAAIAIGRLRLDLYHRLNVFPIQVPPLRARAEDIGLLAQYFLDGLNRQQGTSKSFSSDALARLRNYDWPGNVRELRNFIQRAYILSDQRIETQALTPVPTLSTSSAITLAIPVGSSLSEVDRKLIFATLDLCGGVKKQAADLLGISLKTLYNRLEEYARSQPQNSLGEAALGAVMARASQPLLGAALEAHGHLLSPRF